MTLSVTFFRNHLCQLLLNSWKEVVSKYSAKTSGGYELTIATIRYMVSFKAKRTDLYKKRKDDNLACSVLIFEGLNDVTFFNRFPPSHMVVSELNRSKSNMNLNYIDHLKASFGRISKT